MGVTLGTMALAFLLEGGPWIQCPPIDPPMEYIDMLFMECTLNVSNSCFAIQVFVSNLNGGSGFPHAELTTGSSSWLPVALDVDWIEDNVYVLDQRGRKIDVFDIDTRLRSIVLSTNLTRPYDIALDPIVGYVHLQFRNTFKLYSILIGPL